jgi:hypothetical protein
MNRALSGPLVFCLGCLVQAFGCGAAPAEIRDSPPPKVEVEEGFVSLVGEDGRKNWVAYNGDQWPEGWELKDGVLHRADDAGDLMTVRPYGDFELRFDWKVARGGNSGVVYRAAPDGEKCWHTGPEYQVLDNAGHRDGKNPLTSAGAVYAVYPRGEDNSQPAGEWNSGAIVLEAGRLRHFLNGRESVSCEIGSEDWNRRVSESKFAAWPQFGKLTEGRIVLQDHGDEVWFANVRIKELGDEDDASTAEERK